MLHFTFTHNTEISRFGNQSAAILQKTVDFRAACSEKFCRMTNTCIHAHTHTHTHTHTHKHTHTRWAPTGATAGGLCSGRCENGEFESAGSILFRRRKLQHTNSCLMRMICSKAAWTSSSMWPCGRSTVGTGFSSSTMSSVVSYSHNRSFCTSAPVHLQLHIFE